MGSSKSKRVLLETDQMRITKHRGKGAGKPVVFDIETMGFAGDGPLYEPRRLVITTTELFDLAEALDDICDAIEDNDTELAKNSRSKQVL